MGYPVTLLTTRVHLEKKTEVHLGMSQEDAKKSAETLFSSGLYDEVQVFEARCLTRFGPEDTFLKDGTSPELEAHHYDKGTID